MIKLYRNDEIIREKWDAFISKSINKTIFAYSWYLDTISENWSALILDDYYVVMPFVHTKKYMIEYIYMPFSVQKFGVFYQKKEDEIYVEEFIELLSKKFKLINLSLNNILSIKLCKFKVNYKSNFELDINKPYDEISRSYKKLLKRKLKKAENLNLTISEDGDFTQFITLRKSISKKNKNYQIKESSATKLLSIFEKAFKEKRARVFYAYKNTILCAMVLFLSADGRIVIYPASNEIGKKENAIPLIIDHFIKINANNKLVLDFAGSCIQGVAFFNKSFGSKETFYSYLEKKSLIQFIYNFISKFKLSFL